jgi:hypothetical protein
MISTIAYTIIQPHVGSLALQCPAGQNPSPKGLAASDLLPQKLLGINSREVSLLRFRLTFRAGEQRPAKAGNIRTSPPGAPPHR